MVCKMSKYGFNAINVVFMSPLHGEQMVFDSLLKAEGIYAMVMSCVCVCVYVCVCM